jgi:hypothetical protein
MIEKPPFNTSSRMGAKIIEEAYMKKYSWILALLLALTMAFVFSCGGGDSSEEEQKEKEKEKEGEKGGEKEGEKEGEEGSIFDNLFKLGELVDGKIWATDYYDGDPTDLPFDTFKEAKYLILDLESVAGENGFGGFGIAVQASYNTGDWNEITTEDFTDCSEWLDYDGVDPFYVVIELSSYTKWDDIIGGTGAKIILNVIPTQIEIKGGYLASVDLTKPAADFTDVKAKAGANVEIGSVVGWAAKTLE